MESYVMLIHGSAYIPQSTWDATIISLERYALLSDEERSVPQRRFKCWPDKLEGVVDEVSNYWKLRKYLGYLRLKKLLVDEGEDDGN